MYSQHCTLRPCISASPLPDSLMHKLGYTLMLHFLILLCTRASMYNIVCRYVDCRWIASRNLLCNYCGYALLHLAVRYFCADKMKMTWMLCATILFCLPHLSASQRELPEMLHTRVCTVSHGGEILTLLANHW